MILAGIYSRKKLNTILKKSNPGIQIDRIISIGSPRGTCDSDYIPPPKGIINYEHLRLEFHDGSDEVPNTVSPQKKHIEEIIDFVLEKPDASYAFHCLAGISRSPAAAIISLATVLGDAGLATSYVFQMQTMLKRTINPNIRMICLADELLYRKGILSKYGELYEKNSRLAKQHYQRIRFLTSGNALITMKFFGLNLRIILFLVNAVIL